MGKIANQVTLRSRVIENVTVHKASQEIRLETATDVCPKPRES